jgi:hypothetical protein
MFEDDERIVLLLAHESGKDEETSAHKRAISTGCVDGAECSHS